LSARFLFKKTASGYCIALAKVGISIIGALEKYTMETLKLRFIHLETLSQKA